MGVSAYVGVGVQARRRNARRRMRRHVGVWARRRMRVPSCARARNAFQDHAKGSHEEFPKVMNGQVVDLANGETNHGLRDEAGMDTSCREVL
jgi:hypothetical protein